MDNTDNTDRMGNVEGMDRVETYGGLYFAVLQEMLVDCYSRHSSAGLHYCSCTEDAIDLLGRFVQKVMDMAETGEG